MKKLFLISALLFASSIVNSQTATKAAQDTGNAKLNLIRLQTISNKSVNVIGTVTVAAHAVTISGGATSALQTTGNNHLSNIANATGLALDAPISTLNADLNTGFDNLENRNNTRIITSSSSFTVQYTGVGPVAQFQGDNQTPFRRYLKEIHVTATQSVSGVLFFTVRQLETLMTASSSSTVPILKWDGQDVFFPAAPGYTVRAYSQANGSSTAGPGNIMIKKAFVPSSGTGVASVEFDFKKERGQYNEFGLGYNGASLSPFILEVGGSNSGNLILTVTVIFESIYTP